MDLFLDDRQIPIRGTVAEVYETAFQFVTELVEYDFPYSRIREIRTPRTPEADECD